MAQRFQASVFAVTAFAVIVAGCSNPARDKRETDDESAAVDTQQVYPVTPVPPVEQVLVEGKTASKSQAGSERPPKEIDPVAAEEEKLSARERKPASQLRTPAQRIANAPRAMAADPAGSRPQRQALRPPLHAPKFATPENTENYGRFADNPLRLVAEHPVSTFSIDVDTGSYTNVRRMLMQGQFPPVDAVRAEEFINYFDYADYSETPNGNAPFTLATEMGPSPWNANTSLLRIGLRGNAPAQSNQSRNLVFLIDVSGSMQDKSKLPLLKSALKLLTHQLNDNDRISIAVYAGAAGAVLEPTAGSQSHLILNAIDRLSAGGSTNGGAGIKLAYQMARQAYIARGVNRVILATDGDFNVGTVDFDALKVLVAAQRESGVALTTLGFGSGNYNDHLMEQVADVGNGNYFYIDTLNEARKVLVRDLASTVQTIASDVKIQIEFNPAQVAEYRLIGYENRSLKREDFNNDQVDAGEIGAGHRVTALYEVTLRGSGGERIDPLRYGSATQLGDPTSQEVAFVRLRYKPSQGAPSRLIERVVTSSEIIAELDATSPSFRFAAAVSAFAQGLRGSDYLGEWSFGQTARLAGTARGNDPFGYRGEFIQLVQLADALNGPDVGPEQLEARRH